MNLLAKITDFVGGGLFKEAKELIKDYWPPEVSPEKRAEFELRMNELESAKEQQALSIARDEMALTVDDRKSARLSLSHSAMPQVLSFMLTAFIAGIVYLLFYVGVPEASKESLLIVLGIVIKEWGGSMQFWFGTTRSSQEKNKIIAQSDAVK
jgi:hypothetical protein